jgi:hypothetical protein
MAETTAASGPKACVGDDTHLVVLHVARKELRADGSETYPDVLTGVATAIEGVGRVSAETARRIACDAELTVLVEDALGRPLGVGRQSKKVPRWLRRALKRRDRGCCRFPGCLSTRPDGSQVPERTPAHEGDGRAAERDNLARRLDITGTTSIPNWDGTPPDYSLAVGLLLDVSAEAVG